MSFSTCCDSTVKLYAQPLKRFFSRKWLCYRAYLTFSIALFCASAVADTTAPILDVSGLSATVESGTTALGSVSANESVTWSVAGNAAFSSAADVGSETDWTGEVALGDINGDGYLDVVVGNLSQTNKLYLGDGAGGFGASTTIGSEADSTFSIALGDVNGDGHLDVVAGNVIQTNKLYLGDGTGGFGASTTIGSETDSTYSIALVDVNGDGHLDVVAGNEGGTNKLYLGDGTGGFGASTTIGSETDSTTSIALGDVNGDGNLDVVAGNHYGINNKLYLGDGSGGFGASTTISSETDITRSIALGDVNGDGHLDVVAGNGTQTNKLYLGDGSGGFGASTTIGSEAGSTYSIALGDVNGDGHLDVVAGNGSQNKLYLGDGSGGFGASTTIGSETDITRSIALGDVNGDGHLDVVAGNGSQNKLYLNESIGVVINASGVVALTSPAVLADGSYSFDVKAVDAAGNVTTVSHTTNVTAPVDSTAPTITSGTTGTNLAENSGAGQTVYTITATDAVGVTGYAIGGADASLLTLTGAVVTLDANPDYETKNSYSFAVTASDAAGNTSGATTVTFAITDVDEVAPVITVAGANPATVVQGATYSDAGATADGGESVTSSGTVDTSTVAAYTITYSATDAAGNTGTATRTVNVVDTTAPILDVSGLSATVESGTTALGSVSANESVTWSVAGNAAFSSAADVGSEAHATYSIALGDINGDGYLDVVVANISQTNKLYFGDGRGGFGASTTIGSEADSTRSIALGDVNGDGHLDVVAGNATQTNKLYFGDGRGGFGASTTIGSEADSTFSIALGDVNGDGHLDVVVGNRSQTNKLYFGDGRGGFGASTTIGSEADSTFSIALGDVNGDGHLDVVAGNHYGINNKLYLGDGTGGFGASTTIGSEADSTFSIALGDVNGDGHLDVVAGNGSQTNKLYLGDGSGGFGASTTIGSETGQTFSVALGDVNGDGHLDVAVGNWLERNKLYLGDGSGGFGAVSPIDGNYGGKTVSVALGDVNGDGHLDVVAGSYNQTNKLYLNESIGVVINASGVVALTSPAVLAAGSYSFDVKAVDAAGNVTTVSHTTNVTAPVDSTAPTITSGTTGTNLAENSGAGQTVYTITATDAVGVTGYAIGGADASLLTLTGAVVTLDANPDYETKNSYSFAVTASDAAGNTSGATTVTFAITDVDEVAPVITVAGANPATVVQGATYSDAGATADGGESVASSGTVNTSTVAAYTITYSATDAAGNTGTATRTVNVVVDTTAPVITVIAGTDTVERGNAWTDAGATADGGESVTSSGTVDTSTVAAYTITYSATDAAGNTGTATRTVNVVDTTAPILDVSGLSATVESGTTALGSVSANESVTWSVAGNAAFSSAADVGSETDWTGEVALGDINGDGYLDVVVGNLSQTNKLYLGDGAGGFGASTTIGSEADSTFSIALGDVNGDGHLDVVAGNGSQTNKLYLGDGTGGFGASTTIGSETDSTYSIALVDVNGDGHLDVVAGNEGGTNKLYLGDGTGGFGASTTIGSETDSTTSIALGDVNGDGNLDVVAGSYNGINNKLYLGDGSGGFGASTTISSETDITRSIALGDVNGDGHLDVVAGNGTQTNKLYLGDGSGGFGASTTIGSEAGSTYSIALGDVNGDGHLDVVAGNGSQNKLYLGDGSGGFGASTTIGSETDITRSIALGDVNGDGHLDVVAGNATQTNKLYLNESIGVVINASGVVALTSPAVLADGSYSFDVKAVDAAGNVTTVSHTTNVTAPVDSTAPTITSGTTGTNLAENSGAGQTVYTITATDTVGVTGYAIGGADASLLTLTGAVVTLDANPDYETKNSYSFAVTASDAAGNTSGATTVTFAITDADEVAPVITVTGTNPVTVVQGATYNDAGATADGGESVASSGTVNTSTVAAYTITYSATDAAGNTGTATRTVNVIVAVDATAPVITVTAGTDTVERGNAWTDAGATTTEGTISTSGTVNTAVAGTYTITYSATDAAGNTGTATRTVNVVDATAPVITVIAGTDTVERGNAWTDAGATTTEGTISTSGTVNTAVAGTYTITYSATDAAGNTGTATRTVNVVDTTAPVITVIAGTDTVERGNAWTDAGATTTEGTISTSGTVNTAVAGTYTITYSATDAAGNTGTATRTVNVVDTTAPVITVIAGTDTVERGSAWTDAGATADGGETVTSSGTVDTSTVAAYTVTYSATDAAGNTGTATRTVNIVAVDTTAPVITVTAGTDTVERGSAWTDAGATSDGGETVTSSGTVDTSTVAAYTITYSATDAAGNTGAATRTVNVVDTTAPVITVIAGTDTVERGNAWTDAGATADGGETVTSSGTVDTSTVAAYTITYSATDAAGNTGAATRTVNVVDTTAPVITVTAGTDTVERGNAWTDAGATADGGETVTSSGTVDTSTVAAYTITYSATDAAGNTGTATRTVNVVDTTAPVITVTAGTDTVERGSAWTDAGATSDGGETVTSSGTVDTSTVAAYTITYSATDAAGNTGTATRTVNVVDTTAPVITLLGGAELTLEVGDTFTDAGATATDTVDGNLSVDVVVTGSVDTTSVGSYTLTYNVSDAAGNAATPVTRIVIVADTVAPAITLLGDAELTLEVGDTFTDAGATATDTVDGNLSVDVVVTGSVDTTSVGSYTLTYNVSDAAGNAATPVTRIVIVADTVAPAITLLGDAELTLEVGDTFTDAGATATDTVDGNLSDDIVVTGSVDTTSVGSYTLTYNVSDAAGNAATPVTRIVIVADTVAPAITLLGDAELTLEVGDTFTDAGATATDTVDGNLSDDIVVTGSVDTTSVGSYTLTYNVSDAAGNAATPVTRIVIVADTVAPVITLLGDAELTLEVGDTFTDAGATATDTVDGNLSDDIVVTGSVDTTSVGSYTLTYNVSDAAGNAATPVTRTVVVNEIPITIIVPNDITVNAVGYLTAVDLDPQDISFAVDGDGNTLAITPDQFGLFQSGTYEIIWSATNGISTVTETQILKVVPLVNLGTPITTTEGDNLIIDVILSGTAADYPVSVPFTISGTAVDGEDYTVDPSGMVTISDGTQGLISLSIITDDIAEPEESVVITIGEPLNASLGVLHEQIVTIAEENLAPKTALMVSQGDVIGTTVTKDQGLVTVTADIDDANADDVHTINWASALNDIPNASVDPETQALIFDPADLDVGVTELAAEVSDGTNIVSVYVVVNIIDQAPVLSDQADSDGDGLTDADEGAGDIDGDNIPDYQDSISHPNVIAADFGVLQSEPGTIITLGARALAAGRNVVSLLNKGAIGAPLLEADPAYEFANNLIDFELNGAEFGYSYRLVVPLEFELNEGAVYRKYVNDIIGWQDFIYDANNDILSTFAVDGACPAPGSDVYTPGLKAGHNCIELVIEEGGPNDADGIVNGNLVDPGGVADKYIGTPSELSEVRLRTYKMLANGVDTTVITVTAYDADGVWLDHMSVSASSLLPGAQISEFTAQGNGVYTAILTAGNKDSNGPVTVVIDNGKVSVSLRSDVLRLETPGIDKPLSSGGCTVATNGSTDASLLLLLIMSGLLLVRRRLKCVSALQW